MRFIFTFTFLLFLGYSASAQTQKAVRGTLQDSTGQSVIAASVKLISSADSLITTSDSEGKFNFSAVKGTEFKITITSLGYQAKVLSYQFSSSPILDLGIIRINESS